ncbi:MAG: aconitate hydratase AcnA [Planctomycetes bacterium]|jgi:aconitate hydratase|nr:aconitate hydratase AcnA [Planctomycetota bacterium]
MSDSFQSHGTFEVEGRHYRIARLSALKDRGFDLGRLPFALKILLENLLRREDGGAVPAADIEKLASWKPNSGVSEEIAFMPARVLLQDFTGVPAVVDLAAMRDAMVLMGGDPKRINPLQPVELVIDHSVQVDRFAAPDAAEKNSALEFERNRERYLFLRWGQSAYENFRVVPPNTGIVHQVNLEYLARGVMEEEKNGEIWAFPDTLVGTDSHTTMINGLGVLGWGVGGIEAEAAMLGQPISMLIPQVVGFRLVGKLAEGSTATDLVLTIVQVLRAHGVVGKFVEFFGAGLANLSLADRATIANMAPEYGATCGIFPVDEETIRFLRFSARPENQVRLVEAYMREQELFHTQDSSEAEYSEVLELDISTVEPSLAGPKRPQDRLVLSEMKSSFEKTLEAQSRFLSGGGGTAQKTGVQMQLRGQAATLTHGSVVIAAITSCTNTSNPSVMLAAGLVAKKANALGLKVKPYVKTSLAPGSQVVTDYLEKAGLQGELEEQGFHTVGYGCTTCIGNSGPLLDEVSQAVEEADLLVASVLSGNRNFEGRVHQAVRANYLASPPLVVAYALAGRVDFDPKTEPLGEGSDGPVFLEDIWPTQAEVAEAVRTAVTREQFETRYRDVFAGPDAWRALDVPEGDTYAWDEASTYVKSPPFFKGMGAEPNEVKDIHGARCLVMVGDSITTDHISPAGAIKADSPAGKYLQENAVAKKDFNSYGSRRGNHEVMMRGTFANIRLKNQLTPGVEGSSTLLFPGKEAMSIFDAAMRYKAGDVPTIVLAGAEYGTGSSRDWAAKGPALLGVRAVIAQSYERIHRSNLVGMGVLPLEFPPGENAESLGLTGHETFDLVGLAASFGGRFQAGFTIRVCAKADDARSIEFDANVRIDTPEEAQYYRHGGILHYVLRRLLKA